MTTQSTKVARSKSRKINLVNSVGLLHLDLTLTQESAQQLVWSNSTKVLNLYKMMGMNLSSKDLNFASKMTKQKTDRKRDIMATREREDHPYYFLKNPEAILRYKYKGEDRAL